jgi:uncharacterized membrane protein (DUF106 family)
MVKKNKKITRKEKIKAEVVKFDEKNKEGIDKPEFDFKIFLIIFLSFFVIYLLFFNNAGTSQIQNTTQTLTTNISNNLSNSTNTTQKVEEVFLSGFIKNVNEFLGIKIPFISPLFDIIIISLILTTINLSLTKIIIGKEGISKRQERKEELKKLRKLQMQYIKTNPEKAKQVQKESMTLSMESFKDSFNMKVLLFTMPIFAIMIPFINVNYSQFSNILFGFGWFGTFLTVSLIGSIVLNKFFKVQ